MKRIVLSTIVAICMIWSVAGCSFSKDVVEEAYDTYQYENQDGTMAEISINDKEISFCNIDISIVEEKKAAALQLKEGKKLEAEGNILSEEEKRELLEECREKISVDELKEGKHKYISEYAEETQNIYFDITIDEEIITMIYDLKRETLDFYDMKFIKK